MTQSYKPIIEVPINSHTQHEGWSMFDGEVPTLDIHLNEWFLLRNSSVNMDYLYQPSFERLDNNLVIVLHEMYKVVLCYANQPLRASMATLYLHFHIKPCFCNHIYFIFFISFFLSFFYDSFTLFHKHNIGIHRTRSRIDNSIGVFLYEFLEING